MAEEDEISDAEYEAATEAGRRFEEENPRATVARYDAASGRLVIDFANGSTFMVPARQLQDLTEASDADLAEVELWQGYAVHWEKLDVDFEIPGLLAGRFGTERFMRAQSTGGQLPSSAPVPAPWKAVAGGS